jgi:hypothetical protein
MLVDRSLWTTTVVDGRRTKVDGRRTKANKRQTKANGHKTSRHSNDGGTTAMVMM